MCIIICNALVRVSHRMVSFSEHLQHLNFHPDSDLVFLLRRFLLTRWRFSKPWWDCDLLCWSRTSWRVQVLVPCKVVFSTIFVCVRSAFVPRTDITLKNKIEPSSSQFSHCTKRGLIILHVYFVFLFFQENVILGSGYPIPLGEHHPGKIIEDVYKDDRELRVREQSNSVSRFFLDIDKTPPSSLLKLLIVVTQKCCFHGNVTSPFSSL